MPDLQTAFFGRNDHQVEPLYRAALGKLSREGFIAFRDARAALIRQRVEAFLGLSTAVPVFKDVTAVYAALGYVPCSGEEPEPAFEKIAIFANGAKLTNVARQLPGGRWTSTLGGGVDTEHELNGLSREVYGTVALILKRPLLADGD